MSGWEITKKEILKNVSLNKKNILDIGCGNGWFLKWCSKAIENGVGIDPSDQLIYTAKDYNNSSNIEYIKLGGEEVSQLNKTFDIIFLFNSFHHVPNNLMMKALIECSICMNKKSLLLIIEPIAKGNFYKFMKDIDDEFEVRELAYENIKLCKKANLYIKEEIYYDEVKVFDSPENCINFLQKVDIKRIDYIKNNLDNIINKFNYFSSKSDNKYEFIQPMRLNILELMKG